MWKEILGVMKIVGDRGGYFCEVWREKLWELKLKLRYLLPECFQEANRRHALAISFQCDLRII